MILNAEFELNGWSVTHRGVNTLVRPSGKFRVIIFQREDGSFGFEDQKFSDDILEQRWIPRGRYSECFCDSAETAAREARSQVDWLANPEVPPTVDLPRDEPR